MHSGIASGISRRADPACRGLQIALLLPQFTSNDPLPSSESHAKLVESLDVHALADEVPFDVRFFFPSHRKSPKSEHFLHDSEDGFDGFFSQFVERFSECGFESVGHDFGDARSGKMGDGRVAFFFKVADFHDPRGGGECEDLVKSGREEFFVFAPEFADGIVVGMGSGGEEGHRVIFIGEGLDATA